MGKQQKKRASNTAVASHVEASLKFEGTPDEHVVYLQRKIISLQELLEYKNNKLQRLRKRDIQLGKLSDKHEEQLDVLEEEHEKQFKNLEERHEREFDKLTARHEQEIEELESRQDREADKLESKFGDIFSDGESSDEKNEEEQ